MTQNRDSHGRFKPDHGKRNIAIGSATAVGAVATALASALHFGLFDRLLGRSDDGHPAPDLAPGAAADRVPDHFRPDGDAAVPASEREALRPPPGIPVAHTVTTDA